MPRSKRLLPLPWRRVDPEGKPPATESGAFKDSSNQGYPNQGYTDQSPESDRRRRSEKRGRFSEKAAAWWLRLKGYRIIAGRVRTPLGEIDLIARRGKMVCFVEVKHRTTRDIALEAVAPVQRKRIERAANWWITHSTFPAPMTFRFDVIAIVPGHCPYHLRNAWHPDL